MKKETKELLKKNNENEKQILEENDEIYTNMVVYFLKNLAHRFLAEEQLPILAVGADVLKAAAFDPHIPHTADQMRLMGQHHILEGAVRNLRVLQANHAVIVAEQVRKFAAGNRASVHIDGLYVVKMAVIHLAISKVDRVAVFKDTFFQPQIIDLQHGIVAEYCMGQLCSTAAQDAVLHLDTAAHVALLKSIIKNYHSISSFSAHNVDFLLLFHASFPLCIVTAGATSHDTLILYPQHRTAGCPVKNVFLLGNPLGLLPRF